MAELIEETDRDSKGRFLPGNRWMMPAWRKGQSGHGPKYKHANAVANACQAYAEKCAEENKRLTWSGLAAHMGISRRTLDTYKNGEVEKQHPGIPTILEYYRTLMESELEENLTSKGHATNGIIFALKNHHGWRDEKHISVDDSRPQLVINVDPDLARKIAGEQPLTIDGASQQIEPEIKHLEHDGAVQHVDNIDTTDASD